MKFTCDRNDLLTAVSASIKATATKSKNKALEGLLIEVKDTAVEITGYDSREGITSTLDAVISEKGNAIFMSQIFLEIARLLPDGIVTVESDNSRVVVSCGRTRYEVDTLDADNYPEIIKVDPKKTVKVKQSVLKEVIEQTVFAAGTEESRPVYMGCLFEFKNNEMVTVAVDGYRMALRREKAEGNTDEDTFIIPAKTLNDIKQLCSEKEDAEALISVGERNASFLMGEKTIFSNKLVGDFLDYNKVIPESFKARFVINRTRFIEALERASLMASDVKDNSLPLHLVFGNEKITVFCNSAIGRAEDVFDCEGSAEDVEIGFNGVFLRDALRAATTDNIVCCINTSSSPCILLPDDESGKFVYMVLPVRLRADQ